MHFSFLMPISTFPDVTPKAGLLRGLDMVATMAGRVTAIVHEVDIPPVHNIIAEAVIDVSAMAAEAEARSRSRGDDMASELKHAAGYFRMPLELLRQRCVLEEFGDRVVVASRTHDFTLLVLDKYSPAQASLAEAVIFGSGGAAMVFPAHDVPVHFNSVVVAWDGSRSSARAVRDSLPVLSLAKAVSIVTIEDDKPIDAASVEGVRRLLGQHDIEAVHRKAERGDIPIGEALSNYALAQDAGLMVMGAYGHSRLREFVLGGATRAVLGDIRLPVLMSH